LEGLHRATNIYHRGGLHRVTNHHIADSYLRLVGTGGFVGGRGHLRDVNFVSRDALQVERLIISMPELKRDRLAPNDPGTQPEPEVAGGVGFRRRHGLPIACGDFDIRYG
jgi:hypothetical protein